MRRRRGRSARADARWWVPILVAGALATLSGGTVRAQAPVRSGDIETRLGRIERQLSSRSLFELMDRLEALRREVQQMRGQLEVQGHDVAEMKQRQRELFLDLDRLSQRVETVASAHPPPREGTESASTTATPTPPPGAPASAPPTASAAPAPAPASAPSPSVAAGTPGATTVAPDSLEEQTAYEQAFDLLKEGRYEQAAKAFQAFLARHAGGRYADNARYWLAEAYYVTRDFPRALEQFETLVRDYPDSPKYPGAQLKIGFIHHEQGRLAEAQSVLEALEQRFPQSTEARLARDRLRRVKADRLAKEASQAPQGPPRQNQ